MYSIDCMNFCNNDKQGIQYCRQGTDPLQPHQLNECLVM